MAKNKIDEAKIKEILEDHVDDESTMDSIVKEADIDYDKAMGNAKLTQIQIHDIKELFAKCIVENMRRADCLDLVESFLQNKHDIHVGEDISIHTLIMHYDKVRKSIFKRTVDTIEQARERYLNDMERLIKKAENANDISTAIKGVKDLAEFEGALKKKDDSKIVLNLIPVEDKE